MRCVCVCVRVCVCVQCVVHKGFSTLTQCAPPPPARLLQWSGDQPEAVSGSERECLTPDSECLPGHHGRE